MENRQGKCQQNDCGNRPHRPKKIEDKKTLSRSNKDVFHYKAKQNKIKSEPLLEIQG